MLWPDIYQGNGQRDKKKTREEKKKIKFRNVCMYVAKKSFLVSRKPRDDGHMECSITHKIVT